MRIYIAELNMGPSDVYKPGDRDALGRAVVHSYGCHRCRRYVVGMTSEDAAAGAVRLMQGECKSHSSFVVSTTAFHRMP